jgi:hypothetical protein
MLSCLAVPALVINTYGNGTDTIGSLKLTSTMLGHVASASDEGMIYVPFCGNLPKAAVGLIYSLCDVAACLLFVAAWAWARSAEEHEDRAVDRATVTADDYSAYVRALSTQCALPSTMLRECACACLLRSLTSCGPRHSPCRPPSPSSPIPRARARALAVALGAARHDRGRHSRAHQPRLPP